MDKRSSAHISHYEKGRKLPSLRNALYLSAVIGCPVEVLFSQLFNQIRKEVFERQLEHKIFRKYE